jgi:hypothetical protein
MTGTDPKVGPVILCMLPMSGTLEKAIQTDWKVLLKTKNVCFLFSLLTFSER